MQTMKGTCALKATWEGNCRKLDWYTRETKSAPFDFEVWDSQGVAEGGAVTACLA